jgi:hypothetical protein
MRNLQTSCLAIEDFGKDFLGIPSPLRDVSGGVLVQRFLKKGEV